MARALQLFVVCWLASEAASSAATPQTDMPQSTTTSRLAKSGSNIVFSWTALGGQAYTGTRAGKGWCNGATLMFSASPREITAGRAG